MKVKYLGISQSYKTQTELQMSLISRFSLSHPSLLCRTRQKETKILRIPLFPERFHIPNHSCTLRQKCVPAGAALPRAARSPQLGARPSPRLADFPGSLLGPTRPQEPAQRLAHKLEAPRSSGWDASLCSQPSLRTRKRLGLQWSFLCVVD